ncbi:adenylyl-sulfate kinase [Burkholderia lata]|uniref:Adenylyl-sulfate kinase n=1 Tax=Burkholderia lata (strain ATCC 17760 / DSM 23089 / LMG 22485 / NCIMB 9086 / R18194 / 383) TaxID=482957 RepID=Q398B2_BURL3|nr:adenylylsulfate kinase [Burkholderia lata]
MMKIERCGFSGVVSSLSVDGAHAGWGASPQRAGGVLWLTGLSGAGKTTLADAVAARLSDRCMHPVVLDGDRLRTGLNRDLGFTVQDRFENVRRIAEVAALLSESGALAIVAVISPLAAMRDEAKAIVGPAFREVYVSTALACCETRDPKGLYAKARRGALPEFTGVSAPYEPPVAADLEIDTGRASLATCVDTLMQFACAQFVRAADARAALMRHG